MRDQSTQLRIAIAVSVAVCALFAISTGIPRSDGAELDGPGYAVSAPGAVASLKLEIGQ